VRPVEPERPHHSDTSRLFRDDTRFALGRIAVFQYLALAAFLFLISGFWVLQVRDHEANSELAERNRIKTVPMIAPRGKILDRDGRVIVDNHSSYTLMLTREHLKLDNLPGIAEGLHLDLDELKTRVKRYASRPTYVWIPIKQELTPGELAFVDSHHDKATFPELEIVEAQRRLYPHSGLAAHALGYVGEVSEQDLNSSDFAKYSQGDVVGKAGVERQYNEILIGVDGQRRVVVDSIGREHETLERTEATPGRSLQLTLDLDLQAVAELAMENRSGAVVALDPRTGEVLAMVSRPAYDPNLFTARIRQSDWNDLNKDPNHPLFNRAIQAQFAPGSTFKPLIAIAGLESGAIDDSTSVNCGGGATWFGRQFKCHARHGFTELHRGIVQSCDVYFYNAGNRIGIDKIAEIGTMAGLGKKTGVDLPSESEGVMPSSKWKLRTQREKWYAGDTISVAIGQGFVTVTPIQLAAAIGGMANGGVWHRPHLVKDVFRNEAPRRGEWNPENIAKVVAGMYGVVNEGGTGGAAHIDGIELCGKTGSAQRISNELAKSNKALSQEMKDNAWFVGFAPRENPEIVVVALYEGGVHGPAAAPIVRDVVKAYFDKKARAAKMVPPQLSLLDRPGK
jgi:penicillin-binding protein 2